MSRVELPEDAVYRACILWDVPQLRASDREDVKHFLSVISLIPSALDPRSSQQVPLRMSPLRRAAEGLKAELSDDAKQARVHYRLVARQPGIRGLLGALLLAWMNDADEADFDRVTSRISRVTGTGKSDLAARCHCKLATWAMDHGWRERAAHHYAEALRYSGKDLNQVLGEVGHWFDRDQILQFGRQAKDMTRFPWILDWVDQAARRSVEDRLKRSFQSPWTRTWTFGGGSVEGRDIQSAGLQASWAGALWMLPAIQRQQSALILEKSREPYDVMRAIALWVRGGGSSPSHLVDVYEGFLTQESVEDLLTKQLHGGRSVYIREVWLETCHALWDQMPQQVAEEMVSQYPGPARGIKRHSDKAQELSLIALLLARAPHGWAQVSTFGDIELGLVTRSMNPGLVSALPSEALEPLLAGFLRPLPEIDPDWLGEGWVTAAQIWLLLGASEKTKWRDTLVDALPPGAIPDVALAVPSLVPDSTIMESLVSTVGIVRKVIEDAGRGHFTGWARSPEGDIARLLLALGRATPDATQALVDVATNEDTSPTERLSSLTALQSLVQEGLLTRDDVESVFRIVPVNAFMTEDSTADQRLEDIARIALRVRCDYSEELDGPLLAGSRDPDARVRQIALASVGWLSLNQVATSATLDAAMLGALYDPNPNVQASAVSSVWRGRFASRALLNVARARLLEVWPQAHRELRIAIAREVGHDPGFVDGPLEAFQSLASRDRSWIVRQTVATGV
jgi:hypothetical protein